MRGIYAILAVFLLSFSIVFACDMSIRTYSYPDSVSTGDYLGYHVVLKNNGFSDCTGGGVLLRFYYGNGFDYYISDPDPWMGDDLWNLGALKPFERKSVTVVGEVDCDSDIVTYVQYYSDQTGWSELFPIETECESATTTTSSSTTTVSSTTTTSSSTSTTIPTTTSTSTTTTSSSTTTTIPTTTSSTTTSSTTTTSSSTTTTIPTTTSSTTTSSTTTTSSSTTSTTSTSTSTTSTSTTTIPTTTSSTSSTTSTTCSSTTTIPTTTSSTSSSSSTTTTSASSTTSSTTMSTTTTSATSTTTLRKRKSHHENHIVEYDVQDNGARAVVSYGHLMPFENVDFTFDGDKLVIMPTSHDQEKYLDHITVFLPEGVDSLTKDDKRYAVVLGKAILDGFGDYTVNYNTAKSTISLMTTTTTMDGHYIIIQEPVDDDSLLLLLAVGLIVFIASLMLIYL